MTKQSIYMGDFEGDWGGYSNSGDIIGPNSKAEMEVPEWVLSKMKAGDQVALERVGRHEHWYINGEKVTPG